MKKEIRHEPFLIYVITSSILFLVFGFDSLIKKSFSLTVVFGIVTIILLIIHIFSRGKVLAEISEEGIEIKEGKFIKWEEILSWEYRAPLLTLEFEPSIVINIKKETVEIRGANPIRVMRYLKKYVSKKRRWYKNKRFIEDIKVFNLWFGIKLAIAIVFFIVLFLLLFSNGFLLGLH